MGQGSPWAEAEARESFRALNNLSPTFRGNAARHLLLLLISSSRDPELLLVGEVAGAKEAALAAGPGAGAGAGASLAPEDHPDQVDEEFVLLRQYRRSPRQSLLSYCLPNKGILLLLILYLLVLRVGVGGGGAGEGRSNASKYASCLPSVR